jgi:hypothetical protein
VLLRLFLDGTAFFSQTVWGALFDVDSLSKSFMYVDPPPNHPNPTPGALPPYCSSSRTIKRDEDGRLLIQSRHVMQILLLF